MRTLLMLCVLTATSAAGPVAVGAPTCHAAGSKVMQVVAGDPGTRLVAQRCERDRWSGEARTCFALAATELTAQRCLDTLTKDQRAQLAGEIDRLATPHSAITRRRLAAWVAHQPIGIAI